MHQMVTLPPCFVSSRLASSCSLSTPVAIQAVSHIRLAIFQHGHLAISDWANRQLCLFRNTTDARRRPTASQVVLQKPIHTVQVAPQRAAGDDKAIAHGPNDIALLAQRCEVDRCSSLCK